MLFIRATTRFILFFGLTAGTALFRFVLSPLVADKKQWRERLFRNWAKGFARLLGMKIRVVGQIPQPPFFLVSNHLSYVDIAALRAVCTCVFVAKADIRGWFIGGKIVESFGTIFINRENRRDIPRAGGEIIETIKRGEGVAVFPEGTSSDGAKILPFNSSFLEFAAQKNLPVHFAAIRYETPKNQLPATEAVCWWKPEDEFALHLFQLFKIPHFECEITFGATPVYSINRKELANKLWKSVNAQFVPLTQNNNLSASEKLIAGAEKS